MFIRKLPSLGARITRVHVDAISLWVLVQVLLLRAHLMFLQSGWLAEQGAEVPAAAFDGCVLVQDLGVEVAAAGQVGLQRVNRSRSSVSVMTILLAGAGAAVRPRSTTVLTHPG